MNDLRRRLARLESQGEGELRHVTLQLAFDSYDQPIDWDAVPSYAGVTYVIALPHKAPSAEAWRQAVQARFGHEQPGDPR
jgi:hypothetical protein